MRRSPGLSRQGAPPCGCLFASLYATRVSLGCRKRTSSLMAKAQDREEAGEGPGQPSSRAHLPRRTLTKRSDEHPSRHVPSCSLNHSGDARWMRRSVGVAGGRRAHGVVGRQPASELRDLRPCGGGPRRRGGGGAQAGCDEAVGGQRGARGLHHAAAVADQGGVGAARAQRRGAALAVQGT
jgi:hypothetical protein